MFFKLCQKFEKTLERKSPLTLTFAAASGAAVAIYTGLHFEYLQPLIANTGGALSGACVIIRQTGFKKADNMKKLNIAKSAGALTQYALGGFIPALAIIFTDMALNNIHLRKKFETAASKIKISLAGAGIVTAASIPSIVMAFNNEALPISQRILSAGLQALPMTANYCGIAAAAAHEAKNHRLLMGAGGLLSVIFDIGSQSYGMLVSSVGSTVSTGIGWWKHDRQPKQTPVPA